MTESSPNIILMFRSRERLLAVPLENVIEVVPAFELLQTPGLAPNLAGMISLRGEVLPVIDTAVLIGDDRTILKPQHKFIVLHTSRQSIALLVDTVEDLVDVEESRSNETLIENGHSCFKGVVTVEDEMVLILDVEICSQFDQRDHLIELDDETINLEGIIS
ncbi:MAG: chemotaxis protein CheW [Bacteroidota bacterium]